MKIAVVIVLACFGQSSDSQVPSSEETLSSIVERFADIEDGEPRFELYRALFKHVVAQNRLATLYSAKDDSIAIQAAWESILPNAQIDSEHPVPRPNQRQIAWFRGFFEGRARVVPPDWWSEGIIDHGSLFGAALTQGSTRKPAPYHASASDRFTCPVDATIEKVDSSFVYSVGPDKITIPSVLLDTPGRFGCDSISATFTKSHCFIASHDPFALQHQLVCLERSTNKVVWRTLVCGAWWWGGSGQHKSWVKVVATDDGRVFVFGYAATGSYAHGFQADSGKSILQFSTNY